MARKSYVWLQGALREKTGDNTVIIDGENWTCLCGSWAREGEHGASGYTVMPDIVPYKSMITGETITSRSRHREHLRSHNCIEVGNERITPPKPVWTATAGLREELIARIKN
jgi:hypothetical protein